MTEHKKIFDYQKSFKILAIGNSFSEDGLHYLFNIARDNGLKNTVIGNLYIGGASLELHYKNAQANLPLYKYQKNINGTWIDYHDFTILSAITNEDWDLITLQQTSGLSGISDSFEPYLSFMINYINTHKTNNNLKIGWHLTWAYPEGSDHYSFSNYDNNQLMMYQAIIAAVREKVLDNPALSVVIPVGTAIQNLRMSFIGDTLNRDGFHLSLDKGRYTAGLTWFKSLTNLSLINLQNIPKEITELELAKMKEAVEQAHKNPLQISKK